MCNISARLARLFARLFQATNKVLARANIAMATTTNSISHGDGVLTRAANNAHRRDRKCSSGRWSDRQTKGLDRTANKGSGMEANKWPRRVTNTCLTRMTEKADQSGK